MVILIMELRQSHENIDESDDNYNMKRHDDDDEHDTMDGASLESWEY